MKKTLLICLLIILTLCGCGSKEEAINENDIYKNYFVKLGYSNSVCIAYAKDTKIMYAISCGVYNCGNVTVLVNTDGKPLLYEGE